MGKLKFKCRLMCEQVQAVVTPLPGGTYIQKLLDVVGQAKGTVDVIMYQWVWYPSGGDKVVQQFNSGVVGLLKRGVKFRIVLNLETHGNRLTRENVNTAEVLKSFGAKIKYGPKFPTTHAKLFIIDDKTVILGSHNLSNRACTVNDETSVLIHSNEVAAEYKRYFETLWNRL